MKKDIQKIRIDRIEENTVIAFSDSGKTITFAKGFADVRENDICNAFFNESDELVSIEVLNEETAGKKNTLKNRLKRLFSK